MGETSAWPSSHCIQRDQLLRATHFFSSWLLFIELLWLWIFYWRNMRYVSNTFPRLQHFINYIHPQGIIQIHNNVLWDREHSNGYSHTYPIFKVNVGNIQKKNSRIMSISQNIVMDLNNVMIFHDTFLFLTLQKNWPTKYNQLEQAWVECQLPWSLR